MRTKDYKVIMVMFDLLRREINQLQAQYERVVKQNTELQAEIRKLNDELQRL